MQNIFIMILQGIKAMGFSTFITYSIFWLILRYLIQTVMFKNIELLLHIDTKVYWYDILFLSVFIFIYIYGIYLFGKYLA